MPVVKKSPAKKSTSAKSTKAPAKKAATAAPAKRPVGRPRKTAAAPAPVVKKTSTRKQVEEKAPVKEASQKTVNPRQKVGGMTMKEISEATGFGMGTQSFIVAVELIRGGRDRKDIINRVSDLLPKTTRTGTNMQVSNVVGNIITKMVQNGFKVKGTWSMVK